MGHIRLGTLPRTRPWQDVIAFLAGGADVGQIATAILLAAERALGKASDDTGLLKSVELLMRLPFAARRTDFREALAEIGVHVSRTPGTPELIAAVTSAIDDSMANNRGRTDLGEMAQQEAVGTVNDYLSERVGGLFDVSPEETQAELGKLGTVKQFGLLARDFFGRLMDRTLQYFVSRVLSDQLGDGRFTTLAEQTGFSDALRTHCHEASAIVEHYSGEWLSKHRFEHDGQIDSWKVQDFTSYAMQKLTDELNRGVTTHAS